MLDKRKMSLLLLIGFVIFSWMVLATPSASAAYARGTFGTACTPANAGDPNDTSYFPYRFICGTHAGNEDPTLIRLTGPGGVSIDDKDGTKENFQAGSTIHVRAHYTTAGSPKGRGGESSRAITWITIDGGNAVQGGTITNYGSGNPWKACPGDGSHNNDGSRGAGPVYGYRDLRKRDAPNGDHVHFGTRFAGDYSAGTNSQQVNGVDASPYAYDPSDPGQGVVNCGSAGKMVYWDNSSQGTDYEFDIRLKPRANDSNVCVRMNVSTHFGGQDGVLPPPVDNFPNGTDYRNYAYQQEYALSHLVKQSRKVCFSVTYQAPQNDWDASINYDNNCGSLSGTIDYFQNGAKVNRTFYYYMQRWNPVINNGAGGWEDVPGSFGPTDGSGNYVTAIDGASYFGDGTPNAFQIIFDTDTNRNDPLNHPTIKPPPGSGGAIFTDDCLNNPPALSVNATVSCFDLSIAGTASDSDTVEPTPVHIYIDSNPTPVIVSANPSWSYAIPASYQDGNHHSFRVYAIDDKNGPPTGPVDRTMVGCGQFVLTPLAAGGLDSKEDPTRYSATNSVTPSYPGWSYSSPPAVPGNASNSITKNGGNVGGPYPGGNDNFGTRSYSLSFSPIINPSAIDEYCSKIVIAPAAGLIDRNGNVRASNPSAESLSCDKVHNRPYFHATGVTGLSAGGEFKAVHDSCAGGGTLGGWHNNRDATYTYGSGTLMNTMSPLDIIGVVSSQGANGGTNRLAFANTTGSAANEYSPEVGGEYGGTYCLNDEDEPETIAPISSTSGVPSDGAYKSTSDLTLTGGTIAANNNVSIFVDGDVLITDNVTFGGGWTETTVPSFVLKAKGNIFIAPNVTQLDGVYIAQKTTTKTGAIYTCANGFGPVSGNDMYGTCKNQLLVNGSFIADKVNLMRTYGSLRDAKPAAPPPLATITWTNNGGSYRSAGDADNDGDRVIGSNVCLLIAETADHIWRYNPPALLSAEQAYDNNYLCVPQSQPFRIAWTHYADAPASNTWSNTPGQPGLVSKAYLQSRGFPHCAQLNVTQEPAGHTWGDNWLCANQDVGLQFSTNGPISGKTCTLMDEGGDNHGAPLLSSGPWASSKIYVCVSQAPVSAPTINSNDCENKGVTMVTNTCAAEFFRTGPELYLSRPKVRASNSGTIKYDAITTLPPVL